MAHVPIRRVHLTPARTLDAAANGASISHFTSLHAPSITPRFQRHSTLPTSLHASNVMPFVDSLHCSDTKRRSFRGCCSPSDYSARARVKVSL